MVESSDDLGVVEDGSTIEVMLYDVQPGRMDDAVRAFQETFASFRPAGFTVLFAAADVAHHRLIWVHRYERGFDLGERFYLGKYPDLVHCLWAGTRYDAVAASADLPARPRASAPPPPPRTLAELADGPTVELKVYEVKQGHWVPFLEYWRRIVTLRRAAGFKVEFAVADIPGHRFVWGVSVDGDFTGQNETYLDGEDRRAANVISDHIGRFEIPKVVYLPVS